MRFESDELGGLFEAIGWRVAAGANLPAHCRNSRWDFPASCTVVSVRSLAIFLGLKQFKIVADLLDLGVLVNAGQSVPLETALKVLQKYGYTVARLQGAPAIWGGEV